MRSIALLKLLIAPYLCQENASLAEGWAQDIKTRLRSVSGAADVKLVGMLM